MKGFAAIAMVVGWPSFLMAGVLEMLVFSLVGRDELTVAPAEARWVTVAARVAPEVAAAAGAGVHPIHFRIQRLGEDDDAADEKSTFVVPR